MKTETEELQERVKKAEAACAEMREALEWIAQHEGWDENNCAMDHLELVNVLQEHADKALASMKEEK